MLDPTEIEARFSVEDGMAYLESIFTEPTDDDLEKITVVKGILESLPSREADFVELYYFRQMKQTDIAYVFGVSQPTVCYRLKRAAARIQFLLQLPQAEEPDLIRDMEAFLTEPLDVQIMHLMWRTTCQSEVASRLGVSQGLVRHRFLRTVKRMDGFVQSPALEGVLLEMQEEWRRALTPYDKIQVTARMKPCRDALNAVYKWVPEALRHDPDAKVRYGLYVRLFQFITANLNILREVQRPSWDSRIVRRID